MGEMAVASPIVIKTRAQVLSVKSRVDRSVDVTLNIPEYNLGAAKELLGLLQHEVGFAVVDIAGPIEPSDEERV